MAYLVTESRIDLRASLLFILCLEIISHRHLKLAPYPVAHILEISSVV